MASLIQTVRPYWELMRFHKPIGILLLLWPTWWALWLASEGLPQLDLLLIFTLGVVVMRAAGCVVNDIVDRDIDYYVARTQARPLVSGKLSVFAAKASFAVLILIALVLVLLTNTMTLYISFAAVFMAIIYPFMKRHTYLPQVALGAAFSMSIPMAFTAASHSLPPEVALVYLTNVVWTVTYDTFYGLMDREDDKKIGVKSTAILFEGHEKNILGSLQALTLVGFWLMAQRFQLGIYFYAAMALSLIIMLYHQRLLAQNHTKAFFQAFYSNHWIGVCIFIGIALHYQFS